MLVERRAKNFTYQWLKTDDCSSSMPFVSFGRLAYSPKVKSSIKVITLLLQQSSLLKFAQC